MFEITKQTVNVSEGQFEEHPESYRPRMFVASNPHNAEPVLQVYELLTNGQAIPWNCLPQKECCGFDFWTIYTDSIHDITMTRVPKVLPEVTVQGKAFPLLKFPQDLADAIQAIPQADGDNGDGDKTSTAGYCTCKIEQPLLDHLPEGSH